MKNLEEELAEINKKFPPSKIVEPYIVMIRMLLTQAEYIILESPFSNEQENKNQVSKKVEMAKTYIDLFFNHYSENSKCSS